MAIAVSTAPQRQSAMSGDQLAFAGDNLVSVARLPFAVQLRPDQPESPAPEGHTLNHCAFGLLNLIQGVHITRV